MDGGPPPGAPATIGVSALMKVMFYFRRLTSLSYVQATAEYKSEKSFWFFLSLPLFLPSPVLRFLIISALISPSLAS